MGNRGGASRREMLALGSSGIAAASLAAPAAAAPAYASLATDGGDATLPAGIHRLTQKRARVRNLTFLPGAQIEIPAGSSLRVFGTLQAPLDHIFLGDGLVELDQAGNHAAFPEWWGARTNDAGTDCLAAFDRCLRAHPVMQLRAGDYHVSNTWAVERSYVRVEGAGSHGYVPGQGTRIVSGNAASPVMRLGPARLPDGIDAFPWRIEVANLNLARSVPSSAGSIGLRAQFLVHSRISQVSAFEHGTGFWLGGLIRTHLEHCFAFRSAPGADNWIGFDCDGSSEIGLAGGNASLFLTDCLASTGGLGTVQGSIGFRCTGAFADTFLTRPETTAVETGIRVAGESGALGGRTRSGHANLHLAQAVLDQCRVGIEIDDCSAWAAIEVSDPYIGLGSDAQCAIRLDRNQGMISITGGQALGWVDADRGGKAWGVHATDCSGLQIAGFKAIDFRRPLSFQRCRSSDIMAVVANPGIQGSQAIAWLQDCSQISVRLMGTGRTNAFPYAIEIAGGQSQDIKAELNAVAPGCVAGGKEGFVYFNGAAASARIAG